MNVSQWQRVRGRLFEDPALFGAGEALAFPDRDRPAVERRLGAGLLEPSPGGSLRPARRRAWYMVPIYVAYRGGGTAGRGVNLAAEPQRLATLRRAASLGRRQLTAPVALVGGGGEMIMIMYSPIETAPARAGSGAVRGYVIASYRTSRLIDEVRFVLGPDVRFRLTDGGVPLGGSPARLADPRLRNLPIGGRILRLAVGRPAAGYGSAVAITVGGTAITLLVALLLFQALRAERRAVAGREALRASEFRYRAVVSALGEGVIIQNADGAIESCNPAAERILGLDATAATHGRSGSVRWMAVRDDGSAFADEDHPAVVTLRTGEPQRGVIMGIHQPGARAMWISIDTDLLRPRDHPSGAAVLMAFADITERRNAERRLRARTAELERVNHDLESFAYSVSHDLRAPLRAIDGFGRILLAEHGERLGPDGRHYLARVHAAALRMGELIEGILKLSRLSRRPFERELVDLSALARQIAAELQPNQPGRHVTFEIEDDLVADADPALIRAVLENLLSNAVKFTSRKDEPHVRFGAEHRHGTRVYFVADNGAGFDTAHAGQLFQPFHRLHADGEFPGNRIGLATVARAVHRHGGTAWAEGTAGAGATFYFSLEPGADVPQDSGDGTDRLPAAAAT